MNEILEYYSTHNVKSTLKKFNITYNELRQICNENNFIKTSEQIKETYKTTRLEKYGSIQKYRDAKKAALYRTKGILGLIDWADNYNKLKENKMKNKGKEVD